MAAYIFLNIAGTWTVVLPSGAFGCLSTERAAAAWAASRASVVIRRPEWDSAAPEAANTSSN